jgi:hypothetical protein
MLDKNKLLIHFRGNGDKGGYDKYGAVIIK